MEVKTLAKVEVSVLSILEKIKDNGGQTVVFSQKLVPNGDLSFQVSAMRDGNNDPDHEEHTEDNEVMVKVNILILGWTHSSTIIPSERGPKLILLFQVERKNAIHQKIYYHNGHSFISTFFNQPTFCAHCRNFIWGMFGNQGYRCQVTRSCLIRILSEPNKNLI